MSRNYLQSDEFRRDDQKFVEQLDARRPKRLYGLKAPIRSLEEAIAEQAIERAKWERRS